MTQKFELGNGAIGARRTLWASGAFYALVAFEFFYMASPFAAYFYGVYGPGLDWLEASASTSWLVRFFMPHVVEETTSRFVDIHEWTGRVLFLGGLAGFAVGAVQVYRAKLHRNGAVTGGLYRHIRHPQYLALIVASIGMLLLWPRYLVAVATVTVVFVYVALARAEERLCLARFPGYRDYMKATGMFLPRRCGLALPTGKGRLARIVSGGLAYFTVLGLVLLAATGIRSHAIESFYAHEAPEGIYLSLVRIPDEDLASVARIARAAPDAERVLLGKTALIAYVLPTGMYVSEIPMVLPPGERFGHRIPPDRNPALYKVVFTEAVFGGAAQPAGRDILRRAVNKKPLLEVHLDLAARKATATFPPPATPVYGGRQVPVF